LFHIFDGRKKTLKKNKKKQTKTSAKHIRIRLLPEGGSVNKLSVNPLSKATAQKHRYQTLMQELRLR